MILLDTTTLAGATTATSTPVVGLHNMEYLAVQAKFVRAAGGTTTDVYVQTTLDGGATWIDIMEFAFTTSTLTKVSAVVSTTALAAVVTPTDGSLTASSILSGLLGSQLRVKYVVVGTYTGASSLTVHAVAKPYRR